MMIPKFCSFIAMLFIAQFLESTSVNSISQNIARRKDDDDYDYDVGDDYGGGGDAYYTGDDDNEEGNTGDQYFEDNAYAEDDELQNDPTNGPTLTPVTITHSPTFSPSVKKTTSPTKIMAVTSNPSNSPSSKPTNSRKPSSQSPTIGSMPVVSIGVNPTPYPTIEVADQHSHTFRPTPSSVPTRNKDHNTNIPSLAHHATSKESAAPTESEILTSFSSESSISNVTYFMYSVGFVVVAGSLCGFAYRYTKRNEINYTRVHMPEGNLDDDESHGETEMSSLSIK